MNIDALTLTILLVVLIITINIMMSYLRFPNIIDDADDRNSLQRTIKALRLNKMLALLNIPLQQYLATVPLNVIHQHVAACRACTALAACDRCLQNGESVKNMRFCPNNESLLQQRKLLSRL